jgi:molybdate transport system substrate-binding protein
VDLNFGGSSALAVQIVEGAPADVFASANEAQMDVVVDAGLATSLTRFATNRLVVAVPAGSTTETFEDLAASGVRLVLAGPDVPVGAYARAAIEAAGGSYGAGFADAVLANVVSEEPNVRAVLTRVELGEADAGIVYATDTAIAGDAVRAIEIPSEFGPPAVYVVAVVGSEPSSLATEFVEFLLSSAGQAILDRHGFGEPG